MKRKWMTIVTMLLIVCLMAGCGASKESAMGSPSYNTMETTAAADYAPSATEAGYSSDAATKDVRKVIVSMEYTITSQDIAMSVATLETIVESCGGYVESSTSDLREEYGAFANYIVRIPSDKVGSLGLSLEKVGEITQSSRSSDDITDEYYDIDARIQAKEAQYKRLLSMVDLAQNLEELMILEEELAAVSGELDSLKGRIQRYDNQVSYSKVTIYIRQIMVDQEPEKVKYGTEIAEAVKGSFNSILNVLKTIGVALVWLLPYIIIAAIVIVIIRLATRKKRAQRKLQKEKQFQMMKDYYNFTENIKNNSESSDK